MCLLTHINYLMLTISVLIVNVANNASILSNEKQAAEHQRATGTKNHANHPPLVQLISDIVHINHPLIIRGSMLRYIFLSVFALLLLTACGGTDLDKLIKTGECLECDLTGADLTNADLTEANLGNADLTEANLGSADLYEADLSRANLTRANLRGADLRWVDLTGADLTEANLIGASLAGASLTEADLTGANLTEAALTGANRTGAILDDVIGTGFTGALNVPEKYLRD